MVDVVLILLELLCVREDMEEIEDSPGRVEQRVLRALFAALRVEKAERIIEEVWGMGEVSCNRGSR